MLVIRRLVDRHRAYTALLLRGEPPRIFPTSDAEHARILQIYKQDRPYDGIVNDFSEFALGPRPPRPDANQPAVAGQASPVLRRRRSAAGEVASEEDPLRRVGDDVRRSDL
jgi:hypothetical protein